MNQGLARLAAWPIATLVIVFSLYAQQLEVLVSGLGNLLSSTLGTVFPAYPFLALLIFLTAFRWNDFRRVVSAERGLTSEPAIRLAGAVLVLAPSIVWAILFGEGIPSSSVYLSLEVSAASFVLVAYGALLLVNPTMWRIVLPYASLYAVGLVSPLLMLDILGAPLAAFSSYLAASMTQVLGLHVAWQGVSFGFVSASGERISSVVTPVCSAAYSISIYVALLGLMYLDMGSTATRTIKFAVVGLALIPLLNAARIAVMIWFGFEGGSAVFWEVHDWLGYTIFLAFYVVVLVAYSKAWKPSAAMPSAYLQSVNA